ncbi:3691_t:CDS:2, partial [Rhizophagus irregularis]
IQYSLGKPGGAHSNIFCPFLGVQCKDDKKSCQGMKICKIATPEFKDVTHSTDDKNCFTLIPSASQKQKCPIPHIIDGKVELLPLVKTGSLYFINMNHWI